MAKENLNTFWANLIVEELVRCGVDYFCISPGSRSTPLTVAVARNKKAKSIVCYDERNSAFHALGYARARRHADDYARMGRQRCLVDALLAEADPVALALGYPQLAGVLGDSMETDISLLVLMMPLIPEN